MLTIIIDDDRSLTSYNIDNDSFIVVGEVPCGKPRTRRTAVLRINNNSKFYIDTTDERDGDNENDERTGECPLCNEIGTYGANCKNRRGMMYM